MHALQAHARNSRDAARGYQARGVDLELLTALAFALRDTMRRSGPPRRERTGGGSTLEMKPISHRGFAFEVKGLTFIWEDVAPIVRRLKRESAAFLDLLENEADLHWMMALRAQDALSELWSFMQPVEVARMEPRGLPDLPSLPAAIPQKRARPRPVWFRLGVVVQGDLPPYEFCLAVESEINRLRRERLKKPVRQQREIRRRWERGRCVIETKLQPAKAARKKKSVTN